MSANRVGSSHGKFGSDSYHTVAFLTLAPGSPADVLLVHMEKFV